MQFTCLGLDLIQDPLENMLNEILPPHAANVTLMRLSQFVLDEVAHRKIPTFHMPGIRPPSVVMKLDIEGKFHK